MGHVHDDTLLDIRGVEFHDAMILDGQDPVITITFVCQHINCIRDATGTIIEGSPSQIENVFYTWVVKPDTENLDYNWKLVDLAIANVTALL